MNKQPEAYRLAEWLEYDATNGDMGRKPDPKCNKRKAAAELRRLSQSEHEGWRYAAELEQERNRLNVLNQKLMDSLEEVLAYCDEHGHNWMCMAQARATIAKERAL